MEYIYRRPAFMITCVYALYGVFIVRYALRSPLMPHLLFWLSRDGCLQLALPLENVKCSHLHRRSQVLRSIPDTLHALAYEPTATNVRVVAFLCSTFSLIVHGVFLNFGLRLQNALGAFKLLVLVLIAGSGLLSLVGVPGFTVGEQYDQPNNFTWITFWEGSNLGANAFVTGMYNVIW
jgi:hypothetical protein